MLHQLLIRMTSIHCVFGSITCWLSWNLGASASWNPQGLSWPVQGLLNLNFLMSQHERKTSVPIGRYQITPISSYVTPTADQNYLQRSLRTIIRISNTICCPSDRHSFISSYAVIALHYLLQQFFSGVPFPPAARVLHVPPQVVVMGPEVRWPRRPNLCPKISTTREGVVFAVGGRKREGDS